MNQYRLYSALCLFLAAWVPFVFEFQSDRDESGRTDVVARVNDQPVDFSREIKPILSNRCFLCHGPDEETREAGVRLDTFEGATDDSGAIVPFKLDESELVQRIESKDDDTVMPPPGHGQPLTKSEVDLIKRWIEQGAQYQPHWSYSSPHRPKTPTFEDADLLNWPTNEIDKFVLSKMISEGLKPEPEADKLTLARRVSLDLTGLPPTVAQADAFAADSRPDAYERMVDRLLASDAYAEHWAAMWADLARYADSTGYAEDRVRSIWPYRDYVIRSFQKNQPFDQFTIEQLAGDLMPEATKDQLIATAFHRNTLTNTEGGTDDEEFRSAAVVDRTNTTMAVWMGTTMACAQCHTHKYDPITQDEYFQVYAILNNTADNDQPNEAPVLQIFSDSQIAKRDECQAKIERLKMELAKFEAQTADQKNARYLREQQTWEDEQSKVISIAPKGRFVRVSIPDKDRMIQLAEVEVVSKGVNIAKSGLATQSSTYQDGDAARAIDGNTEGDYNKGSVSHTQNETNPWWRVDLGSEQEIEKIVVWNRTDGKLFNRLNGFKVEIFDENEQSVASKIFKFAPEVNLDIPWLPNPVEIQSILAIGKGNRTADQAKRLREYFLASHTCEKRTENQIAEIERDIKLIVPESSVPIMKELESPRTTHVHIRGSHLQLGKQVAPGLPAAFHPIKPEWLDAKGQPNRLSLARWLVDRNNPLTSRVMVNRYWQRIFGLGIVRTNEDFGAQGDWPSHPELLDYLAVEFMDLGWDNRAILKKIVMSATYRQRSNVSKEKDARDPGNVWLSRGPRVRITAESVRDQALFVSGLLSSKTFGPPVQPPAPSLGLKAAFSGDIAWNTSDGEDRYRRAIYTQWRRSSPYPSMETFDVSTREVCDLRRINTNTPLQALVTLNDEVYVEAAQALAKRMMKEGTEPTSIAKAGFRQVLIRHPDERELKTLLSLFEKSKQNFLADPQAAKLLCNQGKDQGVDDESLVPLAAWTAVANVLLNLDEVFQKR